MSQPAHSAVPLYYVRGRGFRFPMRLMKPDQSGPRSLAGLGIVARVRSGGSYDPVAVTITASQDGRFEVASGPRARQWRPEAPHSLIVSVTETDGGTQDYVCPLIAEEL